MLRTGSRQLLRQTGLPIRPAPRIGGVRYQSSKVPRRSVRNGLTRWAIAIGGTYWYMTSPLFNEKPAYTIQQGADSEAKLETIDSVKASSRFKPPHPEDAPIVPSSPTSISPPSINPKSNDPPPPTDGDLETAAAGGEIDGVGALEQEAASQGAFNEETGEINWDCPCLGGMAYGPCGEQFREAFSCFVYSKEEPKGMDCISKFELMQGCFREHPEIYAEEIADDQRINDEVERDQQQERAASKKTDGPEVDEPSVWTPLPHADDKQGGAPAAKQENDTPKDKDARVSS